jgi:hypothetical protein
MLNYLELENINPNGDNVVASGVININFLIFEHCENWVQKTKNINIEWSIP